MEHIQARIQITKMIKERINLVMIKILKNKKKIISITLIIMVIIGFILLNNNFKIIEKITNGRLQNADEETEEQPLISYQVYDNSDESKIKTLVNVNDNSGIEYVEYPDGRKLETNNKTQVSIDYEMTKDENYSFKIKTANNESIQEQTVCVNDEFINKNGVSILKTNQENGYEVLEIENKINIDGFKTYYQIGKNGNWVEGQGKIGLTDYDLTTNKLINEDNTVTISAKIENQTNKNTVTVSKKYDVNTNSTTNAYEAESILDALKNNEINTGLYSLTVDDETYSLRVYSFDGDLNIKADTTLGTEEDVATASEYAKNMIVLKVNGDLTIDEGTTLTAYTSKNGYGGPKGMTIYCTGTINNNGTVSMTARGAKAVGQNVYLWKNTDGSYEYVPEDGSEGNGVDRATGKGAKGSGGGGEGAIGTSYSGGAGGGGKRLSGTAEKGSPNGGKGGDAVRDSGATYTGAGGGAGNPGGKYSGRNASDGENGTGGLLIIASNNILNKGTIEANGASGGSALEPGGNSGGGSINIFYNENHINDGEITANGKTKTSVGVTAYTGSISVGKIENNSYSSTYTNYTKTEIPSNTTGEFDYTGSYSKYEIKETGYYKIECFGANGGYAVGNGTIRGKGGKGGYTSGIIQLNQGEILYVYVGGQGADAVAKKDSINGYNGGGLGTWDHYDDDAAGAGGGSTDIRLVSGKWDNFKSLKSRIMVAARWPEVLLGIHQEVPEEA